MRQLLSFLGLLLSNKSSNITTPLWGFEEIDATSSGELVMRRELHLGSTVEEEFYFPEHGKLIRIDDLGFMQTFQEQKEGLSALVTS